MNSAGDTSPPAGPTLRQAFQALIATLNERGARYAIVGGLATIQHGRIRATDDIDVLLAIPQIALPGLIDALSDRGFGVDRNETIEHFRDDGVAQVSYHDVLVDLLAPVIPAFSTVLDRAMTAQVFGQETRIASAEGLIVLKLAAMRPQDEADIQDILAAYGDALDVDFIRETLSTFSEPGDGRREKLEEWLRRAGGSAAL